LLCDAQQRTRQSFIFAQFREGVLPSFDWACATRQPIVIAIIKVLRDFFHNGVLARRRKMQGRKSASNFSFPIRHRF
jgi:hypothetical protein